VLEAGSSLRGATTVLALLVRQGLVSFAVPSFSTIRSWLLRVGYYARTRPLDRSTPWLWLVDHTIQIGTQKILVILGCPMSQVPFGQRALQLSDLQLLALVPMEKSNAALVEVELERAVQRTGRPRLIVSDQGSDLRKGIADFQSWYPRTAHVPDVAHFGANLLEHAWDDQPRRQQFSKDLQNTSSQLRQTPSAYLLAPRLRPKARFMNVATQLCFARRVLKHLHGQAPHAKALEYYGWLMGYTEELAVWEREHGLVQTAIELVRVDGLHAGTPALLAAAWGELGSRVSTVRIAEQLRAYVTKRSASQRGRALRGQHGDSGVELRQAQKDRTRSESRRHDRPGAGDGGVGRHVERRRPESRVGPDAGEEGRWLGQPHPRPFDAMVPQAILRRDKSVTKTG